jgi:hypothetical protein
MAHELVHAERAKTSPSRVGTPARTPNAATQTRGTPARESSSPSAADNHAAWGAWAKREGTIFDFLPTPRSAPAPLTPAARPLPVQAKLEIGRVDDPLERQADEIAERVVGSADSSPRTPFGP